MTVATAGYLPPDSGSLINAPTSVTPVTASSKGFQSDGWYLFGAIVVSTGLGGTKAAPIVFGILTVALIYQFGLMIEGK